MCACYSEQQVESLCSLYHCDFAHTHLVYISWEPMRCLKNTQVFGCLKILLGSVSFHGRFCVCYRLLKCQFYRHFWTLYGTCCSQKMLLLFIVLLRGLLMFLLFLFHFRNVGTPLCVICFLFQCLFILQWKTQGNYEGIIKRIR